MHSKDEWLNLDPANRLTDDEVALLESAVFFNFLENGWTAINFETLAAADLAPDVVVQEPFINASSGFEIRPGDLFDEIFLHFLRGRGPVSR
jgi:hypothetical protein